jgi:hypothetical protein
MDEKSVIYVSFNFYTINQKISSLMSYYFNYLKLNCS